MSANYFEKRSRSSKTRGSQPQHSGYLVSILGFEQFSLVVCFQGIHDMSHQGV